MREVYFLIYLIHRTPSLSLLSCKTHSSRLTIIQRVIDSLFYYFSNILSSILKEIGKEDVKAIIEILLILETCYGLLTAN